MGFWTRVRFPPNPLPQVTVMPSRWRDSNFRKSHYNIAKLCYRLAMGFTPFHSGFCVGNHAKRLEFRDNLYCTSIYSTGFLIGPRYFIIPGISIYNVIMITYNHDHRKMCDSCVIRAVIKCRHNKKQKPNSFFTTTTQKNSGKNLQVKNY